MYEISNIHCVWDFRAFASRLSILWLLSYWLNTIWVCKLKRRLHRLFLVYTCQNVKLFEISCRSLIIIYQSNKWPANDGGVDNSIPKLFVFLQPSKKPLAVLSWTFFFPRSVLLQKFVKFLSSSTVSVLFPFRHCKFWLVLKVHVHVLNFCMLDNFESFSFFFFHVLQLQ